MFCKTPNVLKRKSLFTFQPHLGKFISCMETNGQSKIPPLVMAMNSCHSHSLRQTVSTQEISASSIPNTTSHKHTDRCTRLIYISSLACKKLAIVIVCSKCCFLSLKPLLHNLETLKTKQKKTFKSFRVQKMVVKVALQPIFFNSIFIFFQILTWFSFANSFEQNIC